jgi:hypothetical protein
MLPFLCQSRCPTLPTLPEKLPDFCRENAQLLCRTWEITHEKFRSPTSGRFSPLQSTCQNGRVFRGKRTRGVLPVFAMRRTKYRHKQRIFHFLLCCFHIFRNFVSAKPACCGRAGHKKLYGIPAFSSNLSVGDGAIEESLPLRRRQVEAGKRRLRTLSSVFSNFAT